MIRSFIIGKKKRRLLGGVILVALILYLGTLITNPGAVKTVVEGERLLPIYYVETPEKKVAFSFDASWGAERTPKILDILNRNNINTTFFLTGIWVEDYPELVKEIAERGHELGNHTLTHAHLASLSEEEIRRELYEVERMIKEVSGQKTTLMRPPFGEYNNRVIRVSEEMGYKVIQWSIDSLDWKEISPRDIVRRVTGRAHNGAIVLFHNNGEHTADVLQEIIDYYREAGYQIVPVSQLIYHDNYYIDSNSGAQVPRSTPR